MALAYQVSCPPGSAALLAGSTLGGGGAVTVQNAHATEPLYIGGDENQISGPTGGGGALTTSTGFRLVAGASYSVVLNGNETLYGRSGTSTVTVTAHVFRAQARV